MNTQNGQTDDSNVGPESQVGEPRKMSRREALALVGKHAVYTAPAVLAILTVKDAHATVSQGCDVIPKPDGCP